MNNTRILPIPHHVSFQVLENNPPNFGMIGALWRESTGDSLTKVSVIQKTFPSRDAFTHLCQTVELVSHGFES